MTARNRRRPFPPAPGSRHALLLALASATAGARAQDAPRPPFPAWAMQARQTMQLRGVPGLAFVFPADDAAPADPEERGRLLARAERVAARLLERMRQLDGGPGGKPWFYGYGGERALRVRAVHALLLTSSTDVQEMLLEAVLLCGTAAELGVKPGDTVVLLDQHGRRVAGAGVDFADEDALVAGIERLLHGAGRLEARAEQARRPEVARALVQLREGTPVQRTRARALLLARFESCAAAVAQARREEREEQHREALDELVGAAWDRTAGAERKQLLPFGTEWVEQQGDPCPPCGMAVAPAVSRAFLSLLAR